MGYLSKAVSTTASYLPAQVTDTLNQTRSYATVTVPNTSPSAGASPNTVAIANISKQTRLLLASSDGYLYIYNLPGTVYANSSLNCLSNCNSMLFSGAEGGECILVKQHRIDPDCSGDCASPDNLAHPENVGSADPIPTPATRKSDDSVSGGGGSDAESGSRSKVSISPVSTDGPAVLAVTGDTSGQPGESSPTTQTRLDL